MEHNNNGKIPGDNPIEEVSEDLLDRKEIATNFARHVLRLDVSKGAVVGIFAPWGYGKTSFLNLTRQEFKNAGVSIISFNPWVFSGAEQLVDRFFLVLSSEMIKESSLKSIGKFFAKYGAALSQTISVILKSQGYLWISALTDIFSNVMKKIKVPIKTSVDLRTKLENEFRQLDQPVVVVLDDIDRLSTQEIRDIFKLIRLTASFPNLIYIVLCDRTRVEEALNEVNLSGRDYLEKIVQFSYDLPVVSQDLLQQLLAREIERVKANFDDIDSSETSDWSDVFREIISPLIRNIRDIRRYVASIHSTLFQLRNEVSVTDLLALEAIRLFLPDVFRLIPGVIYDLTLTSLATSNYFHITQRIHDGHATKLGIGSESNEQRQSNQINKIIDAAGTNQNVVKSAFARLFWRPDNQNSVIPETRDQKESEFLQNKRVAHEYILLQYLEYRPSETLVDVQKALDCMTSSEQLEEFLLSLTNERSINVLVTLRFFSSRFQETHIEPGITALLNVIPYLSDRESPDYEVTMFANAVIESLLKVPSVPGLDSQTNSGFKIRNVMASIRPLISKYQFINVLRKHENYKTKVAQQELLSLEKCLYAQMRSANPDRLVQEFNLIELLCFAKTHCQKNKEQFDLEISPIVTFAIFFEGQIFVTSSNLESLKFEITRGGFDLKKISTIFEQKETLEKKIRELDANFDETLPQIQSVFGIQETDAKNLLERAENWLETDWALPN